MAELPSANTSIAESGGGFAGGTGFLVIASCVSRNADCKPRVFASASAILAVHDYSPGADYASYHIKETRQQVLFVPLPIVAPGAVGRQNNSKVTGTSAITVAAAASGILEEVDASVEVTTGGSIGTAGIMLSISMDGGRTKKPIRLGTATSYTVPYFGIVINFGAGTLNAGDVYTFTTTAPKWDADGLSAMRTQLAAQQKATRSWLIVGDLAAKSEADLVVNEVNGYETENQRFTYARVQVRDRIPLAAKSKVTVKMTGAPNLTFVEVGATGDTITRSSGSWITDGFAVGQTLTVAGSANNNVTGPIAAVTATVITLDTTDLVDEGPVSGCSVTASETLTFAEVGATGDTITRSAGSWLDDGFRAGDLVTITGTASNNVTAAAVTAVTATVLTFDTTDLAAESIRSDLVTLTKGEVMSEWVSNMDTEFAGVDDQKRIDLGLGRARKVSPLTKWSLRRPFQWAVSLQEYKHDVHIATWKKEGGLLDGWDLEDGGQVVEYDERTVGGALAARFTCARTWANGPEGAFVAMSLTRAPDDSLLSRTHNLAVANVFCSIVQAETENWVGKGLVLKPDGTATEASLVLLEAKVNKVIERELLAEKVKGEGQRASAAVWRASRTDILNVTGAALTGEGDLNLLGTLEKISTSVVVA